MAGRKGRILSRDELDLLRYYRELSVQEQLLILERVEARVNSAKRMEELAGRAGENPFPSEEFPWH